MTTITVNIDNKKSAKAVKAVFDALGLGYRIDATPDLNLASMNKAERRLYDDMKLSLEQIKQHQEGKIHLRDASELLNEL